MKSSINLSNIRPLYRGGQQSATSLLKGLLEVHEWEQITLQLYLLLKSSEFRFERLLHDALSCARLLDMHN